MTNLVEQESDVANPAPDYLEDAQGYLIHRFSKIPTPQEPLVLEFTNDKALLHQYYLLRNQMIGRYINAPIATDDIYDKISEVLIARRGNMVIGGCRLTIREGDESFLLPIETENFKIRDLFPNLPLNKERHAIISKFAIIESHKERDLLYDLCKIMFDRVVALDTRYIFARATNYVIARNWRKIATIFGAINTTICEGIDVPENPILPGQKQYITFSDISELCQKEFPRIPVPTARKLELVY